jgi:hypothetical protein
MGIYATSAQERVAIEPKTARNQVDNRSNVECTEDCIELCNVAA